MAAGIFLLVVLPLSFKPNSAGSANVNFSLGFVSTTCASGWVIVLFREPLTHPLPQAVLTDGELKFVALE